MENGELGGFSHKRTENTILDTADMQKESVPRFSGRHSPIAQASQPDDKSKRNNFVKAASLGVESGDTNQMAEGKAYYKKHLLNNPSGYSSVKGGVGIIRSVPSD